MIMNNTNRKSNIKLFLGSVVFAAIILFASCNNSLQKPVDSDSNLIISDNTPTTSDNKSVEMATVKFDVSNGSGRSILPAPDKSQLEEITIYGTWKSGEGTATEKTLAGEYGDWQDFIDDYNAEVNVQTGLWNFRLVATVGGIDFQGVVENKTITAGTSTTIAFDLTPVSETKGGISLTINTSDGAATIVATLKNSSNAVADTQTLTVSSRTATYSVPISTGLTPGDYNLTLDFKAEDSSLGILNTWKGMVRVSKGLTTTSTINWSTDTVYEINYYNVTDATFVDGIKPLCFTRKSATITLPQVVKSTYAFEGWYTESSFQNKVTEIPSGTTTPQNLYARFIDTLYVGENGSGNGMTNTTPFGSVADAVEKIISLVPDGTTTNSDIQWKIYIVGNVTGPQTIESLTSVHAALIKVLGYNGSACLDRNISTAASNGSTLTINTAVPVTILNLTITGGKSDLYGGGIAITSGSVTLDSGSIITGNEATAGGGVSVGSGATLTCEYGNIKGNSATQGGGVHLQSGGTFIMTDGTIGDTSLSGDISIDNCSNKATSIGGAIFGADGSTITLNGGTIAHNFGNNGGAVSSFGTLTVKNTTIYGNNAYSCGGALYLGKPSSGETNFTLDDGAYLYDNVVDSSSGGAIYLEDASLTLNIKGEIYVPFLGVKQNDISLTYNSSTSTYSKINIAGELSKRNGCGTNEPYITITPTGYHTDAVIVTESGENLRKQFCEKIGITIPSEEWPIWSVRPSNGKILDGYEVSSDTYSTIMPSKIKNGGKNVKIIYIGTLSWDDFSGIAGKLQNATDNIYLDFSEAERSSEFTTITNNVFFNRDKLVSIIFPNGITNLGTSLFKDCDGLTSVTLPDDLVSAGDYTFCNCLNLDAISLPSTLETIGVGAFQNTVITSIRIPATVTTIKSEAFADCDYLQSVDFLDTVNRTWKIGDTTHVFNGYEATQFAEMLVNASDEAQYRGTWTKVTE